METNSFYTTNYYFTQNKNIIGTVCKYVLIFGKTFEIVLNSTFEDNQM